jgi:hypothetical protein
MACEHQEEVNEICAAYIRKSVDGRFYHGAFFVGSSIMFPTNKNGDSARYWELQLLCEKICGINNEKYEQRRTTTNPN